MRTIMTPLALIATLGTAGAAFADTTSGTIADISEVTGDVTLDNGMEFQFSEDPTKLDNFSVGDSVSIEWTTVGDRMEGRQISPAGNGGTNELTGVVTEASSVTGMLTLANGMTIDFTDGDAAALDNFTPGETVTVQYVNVGDDVRGLSLAAAGTPANIAEGTIQELNENGRVTLADGSEYDFNGMDDAMLDNFSVGDAVAIHYVSQGDAMVALSISPMG